jgi:hypothetical protein
LVRYFGWYANRTRGSRRRREGAPSAGDGRTSAPPLATSPPQSSALGDPRLLGPSAAQDPGGRPAALPHLSGRAQDRGRAHGAPRRGPHPPPPRRRPGPRSPRAACAAPRLSLSVADRVAAPQRPPLSRSGPPRFGSPLVPERQTAPRG